MHKQTTTSQFRPTPCSLHVRVSQATFNPSRLSQFVTSLDKPCILGGHDTPLPGNEYSYWAANPKETYIAREQDPHVVQSLKQVFKQYKLDTPSLPENLPPFCCGWMGYFSYDLGTRFEPMPVTTLNDLAMPLVHLGFYDQCIAWHHKTKTLYLMALDMQDNAPAAQKLDQLCEWIQASQNEPIPTCQACDVESVDFSKVRSNMDRAQYLDAIEQIKQYILDGETYQINYSHRFEVPFSGPGSALFAWQNTFNPSPYSAYLDTGTFQIVSASPEMFLTLDQGYIQTKPIKGTRPRLDDTHNPNWKLKNKQAQQALLQSSKEQAELNMIIDLERNDLARICVPGTRRVTQPRTLETYATVYHAVATVAGELAPDLDVVDILQATFPGGSITGAPKIRSMQIIDELEPTARGVYTGSMGYISVNQNACLNIAIRTIIIAHKIAYVQTGGGIVADSDPQAEYLETLCKARALITGILAVNLVPST